MAEAVQEFGVDDAEMLTKELDIADIAALLEHIASSPRCTSTPLQRSRWASVSVRPCIRASVLVTYALVYPWCEMLNPVPSRSVLPSVALPFQ